MHGVIGTLTAKDIKGNDRLKHIVKDPPAADWSCIRIWRCTVHAFRGGPASNRAFGTPFRVSPTGLEV
jgi:hypothetical protein